MCDYNRVYGEDDFFERLFPGFRSRQMAAAEAIWDRILGRCGIDWGMPPIASIVDLGCGAGHIAIEFARRAAERMNNRRGQAIRVLGIDSSQNAIQLANHNLANSRILVNGAQCNFIASDKTPMDLFGELKGDVVWKDTALVCLGHTFLHFVDQEQIRDAIRTYRPALLLIDVYHNWDEVLNDLCHGSGKPRYESARKDGDDIYWLRTEIDRDKKVKRGIWKTSQAAVEADGQWLLETTQQPTSTEGLFGKDSDIPRDERDAGVQLTLARDRGFITGETRCDYIQRKKVFHQSGWGEMSCHVLVPHDPDAVKLNQAYFEVVYRIVHSLFVAESTADHFQNLRD